ncbi:MAG: PEP/pyruvate-binding domain-containing protein [Anaerolineae bacterium]|jgi:phosphohistidine swiveling domain-containing protein
MTAPLITLDNPAAQDPTLVGNKAARLAVLRRAGLPVPDGFCITSAAVEFEPLWLPIACMYRRLASDGHAVAVRSSGLDEDRAEASFAGQYETVLNVRDERALREAILACRESAHSHRVTHYRKRHNRRSAPLPVLVQQQIEPSVSGVLFTRDPVSGDDRRLIVEATPGLGDALLGGRTQPHRLYLTRTGQIIEPAADNLLTAEQCHALARMAVDIERILGRGQDIEWALADDTLHILQSRPITGSTSGVTLADAWTRANIGEVLPNVMTPLTWSVFQATLLAGSSPHKDESNGESATSGMRQIAGRGYLRLDALLDTFCYLPTVTPEVMHRVLGVPLLPSTTTYSPPRGATVRLAQVAFALDILGLVPRIDRIAHRQPEPPSRSDAESPLAYIEMLLRWVADCFQIHLKCTAYAIGAFGVVSGIVTRRAPEKTEHLLDILTGYHDLRLAAQGRSLQRLARQARSSGPLVRALQENDEQPLSERLWRVPGGYEFLEGLERLLAEMGTRCAGEFELSLPRWHEDPAPVIATIVRILNAPAVDPDAEMAARQARHSLGVRRIRYVLPVGWRWLFTRGLIAYRRYSTWRENMKDRLMEGMALLRATFLEMGATFTREGQIDCVGDIFFLTLSEVEQLARGDRHDEVRTLVRERREQHRRWSERSVPDLIIGDEPDIMIPGDGVLSGIACCPGIAEGVARVLMEPEQAHELRPGEILVAPHTDPGWAPLFLTCRGIVTEVGGFLSHGATVAREYGIPTVANVRDATTRIASGDIIRVDGSTGQVIVCQSAAKGEARVS